MTTTTTRVLLCGIAVAALSACGSSGTAPASSTATAPVTSTASVPSTTEPATTTTDPATSTPTSPQTSSAAPTDPATSTATSTSTSTVTETAPQTPTAPATTAGLDCSPSAVKGAPGLTRAQAKALAGKPARACQVYKQGTPGFMAYRLMPSDTGAHGWAETAAMDGPPVPGKTPKTDPRSYVEVDGVWHEFRVWE